MIGPLSWRTNMGLRPRQGQRFLCRSNRRKTIILIDMKVMLSKKFSQDYEDDSPDGPYYDISILSYIRNEKQKREVIDFIEKYVTFD